MKHHYKSEQHTRWIPISQLHLDNRVNRDINSTWVNHLSKNFDPDKFFILAVSEHDDGTYVIIDGQHRFLALQEMGWGDQSVECKVFKGLAAADEARLFVEFQNRKTVSAMDKFLKLLVAGDQETVAINKIVQARNLVVNKGACEGYISAVGALQAVYRGGSTRMHERHPTILDTTLDVLLHAWGPDASTFTGKVMEGLGLFLHRYNLRGVHIERLVERLASLPGGPNGLVARGQTAVIAHSTTLSRGIGGAIHDLYNKGLRQGQQLPDWWDG